MADVALVNSTVTPAPDDYTVPGTQELLVKAVRANIDGTGTASTWLPALQLIDPAGHVMWTAVDTSNAVAAGGSADVSWFPGVKAKTSGGSAFTGLPFAQTTRNTGTLADTGFGTAEISFTGALDTNDSSFYDLHTSGGITRLRLLKDGTYLISGNWSPSVGVAPAAGAFAQISLVTLGGQNDVGGNFYAPFNLIAAGLWQSGVDYLTLIDVHSPGTAPPLTVFFNVGQNTGGAADILANLGAVRIAAGT